MIAVTGGMGYIGSHTVVALLEKGYEVVILDNLANSFPQVLDGIGRITGRKPVFEQVDLCDHTSLEKVFEKYPITGCIHFAAFKAVGESVEFPLLYYRNNLVSLLNLLEVMAKFNVSDLIFSSSCTVYGEPNSLPVTENSPIKKAESPYGNTKQIGEEIIADHAASRNAPIRATLLRYFNPIGAHPSGEIGEIPQGVPNNLMPYLTQTAAGIRKELRVFGNDYPTPDGTPIRDYIHVVDLAEAHVVALEALSSHADHSVSIYNAGTGRGYSVLELITAFESTTGVKVPYTIAARRPGDVTAIYADASKIKKELAWAARFSLEDMVSSAWAWEQHYNRDLRWHEALGQLD